jgi:hypothetical protein
MASRSVDSFYVKDAVDATLHLGFKRDAVGLFTGSTLGCRRYASTWIELVTPIFEVLGSSDQNRIHRAAA